ncbi:hypothetical protein [Paraburkholderia sp. WC7.3g]|uniref:hypothetical protein n=1 Tax=Paraburkholderia sp. WC7.3g TaxID=2991070 RepID=UPI003D23ABC2
MNEIGASADGKTEAEAFFMPHYIRRPGFNLTIPSSLKPPGRRTLAPVGPEYGGSPPQRDGAYH